MAQYRLEGVFEIRDQAGDAIIAFNLVDELTYRIRANMGHRAFAPLRPGVHPNPGRIAGIIRATCTSLSADDYLQSWSR
jgi:hypothetical protein